ncbi:hypothetical protein PF007_g20607 [Phytophthora fragariae]|uniref:Uncharacterized protein n=1 Tax=Phytophthora fragariae TaxID=53985 RepID=A0A6A4CET4_9STRA|nr:hypothetical protein PF009_g22586 [Phytophthora fragariae]KAE9086849.1 hypothetical protein PF007_g20607 [Phytophthora fragariae]KAE9290140.1 hypothetical protein PF001_g19730 [Phytophthora fragariae]
MGGFHSAMESDSAGVSGSTNMRSTWADSGTRGHLPDGSAWIDDATILVTSNVDKAILTACAASHFAKRQNQLLFRWKRKLRQELPAGVDAIVYDEDANPELFAYFVAGAPANILDNNSGNVGWGVANGSPCRLHSLGWDDDTKRQEVWSLSMGRAVLACML